MDSDKPYVLDTGAGEIVELPVHWSLDDWEQYAYIPDPPFRSAIDAACRDVARRARESPGVERRVLTPVEVEPGLFPE